MEYERFLRYALFKYPNQLVQWTVCHMDDSAKYYFNEFTREISWEKPDDFVEPEPKVVPPAVTSSKDNNVSKIALIQSEKNKKKDIWAKRTSSLVFAEKSQAYEEIEANWLQAKPNAIELSPFGLDDITFTVML